MTDAKEKTAVKVSKEDSTATVLLAGQQEDEKELPLPPKTYKFGSVGLYELDESNEQYIEKKKRIYKRKLNCQRCWVIMNITAFLALSIFSICLLHQKQVLTDDFFDSKTGQAQCCFCYCIGKQQISSKEIAYSTCYQKYGKITADVCQDFYTIDSDDDYGFCNSNDILSILGANDENTFSYTSTIFAFKVDKSYEYYGILALVFTVLYCVYIGPVKSWFCPQLLAYPFFTGNLLCAVFCSYAFLKAYQYSKHSFSYSLPESAKYSNIGEEYEHECYTNELDSTTRTTIAVFFWILIVYAVFPFFVSCFKQHIAIRWMTRFFVACFRKLDRIGIALAFCISLFYIVLISVALNEVIAAHDEFKLISGLSSTGEKFLLVVVDGVLFVFGVFCVLCSPLFLEIMHNYCSCCKKIDLSINDYNEL